MTKQEQFLWIVQTMVLANAINVSTRKPISDEDRTLVSATGAFISMDEAIRASGLIPQDMNAAEAANEFCSFMFKNLRDAEEKAAGHTLQCPHWFARY
jgi:hypothetical protein